MRKLKEDGLQMVNNATAAELQDSDYPVRDLTFIEPEDHLF